MKKVFALAAMFLLLMSTAFAATSNLSRSSQTAVVIVGGSDYKTPSFTKYVQQYFKATNLAVGNDVQTVYQSYWLDKGLLEEGTPTKDDFIAFANYAGYKNVLYLKISDPVVDVHNRKGKQKTRVSITMNAYLVDKTHFIQNATSTHEEDSDHSELRAKSGAFKQCVRDVSEVINPALR